MATAVTLPPHRRDLILRRDDADRLMVKDPSSGQYFTLEEQEAFLFEHLDGKHGVDEICVAFHSRFSEAIQPEDVHTFVDIARGQHLIEQKDAAANPPNVGTASDFRLAAWLKRNLGGLLYWRKSFFDPDRFLAWLAPKTGFLFTGAFLAISLGAAMCAVFLLVSNWSEFKEYLTDYLSWETAAFAYGAVFLATMLHEMAHGLACKRYGGEVREIGFLFMFFLPCLYCNVSDAWLIPRKRHRLIVTLAGGYCDLVVFTLAIFLWRLALPGTTPYYLFWVLVSVCGVRLFVNFFPLFKLDGYYLLSDLAEVPNLRNRGMESFAAHFRWLCWGAVRPEPQPHGRFILLFGTITFAFTIFYLWFMLWGLTRLAVAGLGLIGLAPIGLLVWLVVPAICSGLTNGEFIAMFSKRKKHLAIWLAGLTAVVLALTLIQVPDRTGGTFKVRPAARAELRAPVSGFLRVVCVEEGGRADSGTVIAWLEVPDLVSRLAQKGAEIREADAKLKLLEAGPRYEEIVEQRSRVQRAETWCDLGRKDLEQKRQAHAEQLSRLEKQVAQTKSQFDFAQDALSRAKKLLEKRALALDTYRDLEKDVSLQESLWFQAVAQKRETVVLGILVAENELAKREMEFADAKAALKLLEVGTRMEEIQAERARLGRLVEEKNYLLAVEQKLKLSAPIPGIVITPRLREKIGSYFKEGDLICEIEDPDSLETEITMEEQDVAKVDAGQEVAFKARALAYESFHGFVDRVAPQAILGKVPAQQSQLLVVCRLTESPDKLCSGMTGYARIDCGSCSLGTALFSRVIRFVRTEYWW